MTHPMKTISPVLPFGVLGGYELGGKGGHRSLSATHTPQPMCREKGEVNGHLQLAAEEFLLDSHSGVRTGGLNKDTARSAKLAPPFVHKTLSIGNHAFWTHPTTS